ncbi:hypothetical protein PG988_001338 [Apiospora saccharicola]
MRSDVSILGLVAWLGASAASTTPILAKNPLSEVSTNTTPHTPNARVTFSYGFQISRIYFTKQQSLPQLHWDHQQQVQIKNATLYAIEGDVERPVAISIYWTQHDREDYVRPSGTPDLPIATTEDVKRKPGQSFLETPSGKREVQPPLQGSLQCKTLDYQLAQTRKDPRFSGEAKSANHPFIVNSLTDREYIILEPSKYEEQDAFDKPLYLALECPPASPSLGELQAGFAKVNESTPYRWEGFIEGLSNGEEPNPRAIPTPGPTSTAGLDPTDNGSTATATPGSSLVSGPPGGGSGGLTPGAIAGIVIGSVVGVLLIVALAYFLCFRRRDGGKQQRRHIHGDVGYASDSGAAAMMMREKDISGVNHSSPQSAFADDGGRLHDRGGVAGENDSTNYSSTPPYQEERGPVAGIGAHSQRSTDSLPQNDYSPYNSGNGDQGSSIHRPQSYAADSAIGVAVTGGSGSAPNAERERNGSVGGGTVGRASHHTSRPGSEVRSPSRYAHLIEEGMTEDEIRRLEDEERQLDAAIEDAGEAW